MSGESALSRSGRLSVRVVMPFSVFSSRSGMSFSSGAGAIIAHDGSAEARSKIPVVPQFEFPLARTVPAIRTRTGVYCRLAVKRQQRFLTGGTWSILVLEPHTAPGAEATSRQLAPHRCGARH